MPIFSRRRLHRMLDELRCVFLVDAGCELLRQLKPFGIRQAVTGEAIIHHALRKLRLDVVCVFSSAKEQRVFAPGPRSVWNVSIFVGRQGMPESEFQGLRELAAKLPIPHFEGHQARDIHKQGAFHPRSRGWYLGSNISTQRDSMTLKISSRLLQEYLGERISAEHFRRHAFPQDRNFFDFQLQQGRTIQNIRFESAGVDEDDDYILFELGPDWAALEFREDQREQAQASRSKADWRSKWRTAISFWLRFKRNRHMRRMRRRAAKQH